MQPVPRATLPPLSSPLLSSASSRVQRHDQSVRFFEFSRHFITKRAVNLDGQIAFLAQTFSSDPFVLRADPVDTARPISCVGLPDDTPCDDGDPDSFWICQTAQCVAVPEPDAGFALLSGFLLLAGLRRARSPR